MKGLDREHMSVPMSKYFFALSHRNPPQSIRPFALRASLFANLSASNCNPSANHRANSSGVSSVIRPSVALLNSPITISAAFCVLILPLPNSAR